MISILKTDAYKLHHREQYPKGTEAVYSNLSVRKFKYFEENYGETKNIIVVGVEYIMEQLFKEWDDNFFKLSWEEIEAEINEFTQYSDIDIKKNMKDYKKLHNFGKLPIQYKYVEDGEKVKEYTPILMYWNTEKDFYWLVNYIETWLSNEYWALLTSANISYKFYLLAKEYSWKTCDDNSHIPYQFHDFSQRGINTTEGAIKTGLGHLTFFRGSDNLPAIMEFGRNHTQKLPIVYGTSIPATEHSVMCAGGRKNELETFERLLELYPNGTLSIVSDTWDIYNVCNNILPKLKDKILVRDGKLMIRPDSGDPVKITLEIIQLLDMHFGSFINEKGYKVLNPKIGVIYGDAITYKVAEEIFKQLKEFGYASSNVVLGVGSYTYQYNTRDTLGIVVKATAVKINGEWKEIQKDPITDPNKKSLTGFIKLEKDEYGIIYAIDKQKEM